MERVWGMFTKRIFRKKDFFKRISLKGLRVKEYYFIPDIVCKVRRKEKMTG